MIQNVFMLITSLCLLNVTSQASGDLDGILLQSKDKRYYQLMYPDIPQDYEDAVKNVDELFQKENKITDAVSKEIESYTNGTKPRHDITLFLLVHMAKKVKPEACFVLTYNSMSRIHPTRSVSQGDIFDYVSKHFGVTPVVSFMSDNSISQVSLCEELQECLKFLSGRHGLLYGLNKSGYKDTFDNESDRKHYAGFLNTEKQLLDILVNYNSFNGFMVTNVTFKGVLQGIPSYQLYTMGEKTTSFVRFYPNFRSFSIGFDNVDRSDFLYSFLYDKSPENQASYFSMKKFLQRKSKIYDKADLEEQRTIESLRFRLAELTGKVENSSFDDTYAALSEQYGLSQHHKLSQDLIEEMKRKYVFKLALATTMSEKIKETHRDIEQQLETLTIIRDKFVTFLENGQQTRNKQYYKSYNPKRNITSYMFGVSLGGSFLK